MINVYCIPYVDWYHRFSVFDTKYQKKWYLSTFQMCIFGYKLVIESLCDTRWSKILVSYEAQGSIDDVIETWKVHTKIILNTWAF